MKYNYKDYIADVLDFPIEGILFRDITPLMANGEVFKQACDELTEFAKELQIDVVVGPESRGFIFGCPIATNLGVGFIPVRKPNKLPRETVNVSYSLEYGTNTFVSAGALALGVIFISTLFRSLKLVKLRKLKQE